MRKISKKKCSLEDEYKFEHLARIKAEKYIKELWEYNSELQKEVSKLQSIINSGEHLKEEKPPLNSNKTLNNRLTRISKDRERAINKMEKKLK